MLLSFVNYELQIKFESRTTHEINALYNAAQKFFGNRKAGSLGYVGDVFGENVVSPLDKYIIKEEEEDI